MGVAAVNGSSDPTQLRQVICRDYGRAGVWSGPAGGCGVCARITKRQSRKPNQPFGIWHESNKVGLHCGMQGRRSYNKQINWVEQECRRWSEYHRHQWVGRDYDQDRKHLRSESNVDMWESSKGNKLVEDHQAGGRRHSAWRGLQHPKPMVGSEVHRMERSCILGKQHRQAWVGKWKWQPTHSGLDKEWKGARIDLGHNHA